MGSGPVVGTAVVAGATAGPAGEFSDLVPLVSEALAVLRFEEVLADAGYDSQPTTAFAVNNLASTLSSQPRSAARSR